MAATGNTYAERISRWDSLIANLEPMIAEFPHLAEDLATLKRMLVEARDFDHQQDDLRFRARDLNDVLVALILDGDKIRRRMGAALQSKYGFTNEILTKFGFKPRRPPVRKKKAPAPAEPKPAEPAAGDTP
jgi:hypothetical protein